MHRIDDAVVHDGQLVLTNLPFADGQHVRIVVSKTDAVPTRLAISEVRRLLKGGVLRFDKPFEPSVGADE